MRPVRVITTGPVAAVAFELDGREEARLAKSPWNADVDFGPEFSPHRLVARAFDAAGGEIARAHQWINLPRPPAEVDILLERNVAGQVVAARLTWASRLGPRPDRVSLTFDGRALAVDVLHRATLPAYDERLAHVLTAQVDFPNDVRGRADRVIGGGSSGEASSELTAVPVRCSKKPPPMETLQGRFREDGVARRVVGVEHGPAEVLVVRELELGETTAWFSGASRFRRLSPVLGMAGGFLYAPASISSAQGFPGDPTHLGDDDRLRVQWPIATESPDIDAVNVLFEKSQVYRGRDATLGFLLQRVGYPKASDAPRRFADAVAVAGVEAAASCSRRAVILVLGAADRDDSIRDPAAIRRYLERLHVPLYVWSLAEEIPPAVVPAAAWGRFDDVSSIARFARAVARLRGDLESQSVVWLEGGYLPQSIEFVENGDGVSLAR